jgi:hypothetical protein
MLNKCIHGIYIPEGDTVALNCSGCGTAKLGIFALPRRRLDVILSDKILDSAEYNAASVTDRLNDAAAMENICL